MALSEENIKKALLSGNYIEEKDVQDADAFVKKNGGTVLSYLLNRGVVTKDLVGQSLAETFKIPYADLNSFQPSEEQVRTIPEKIGKKNRLVLFREKEKEVVIATDQPTTKGVLVELKKLFPKKKVVLAYSLAEDIDAALVHYRPTLDTRFKKIIASNTRVATELVDEILADALIFKASDIHFEPREDVVVVRFRIDGVLQEAGRIEKTYYGNVINKIKIQSNLRIDSHFRAQDGSMHYESNGRVFDIRTWIVPTVYGEKVVLRILSAYVEGFTLGTLGLSSEYEALLKETARKPFGMILTTGPTGSGKTTTLYSVLKVVSNPDVNVTTIEDPVEYRISGVNQIQVNEATDLTFAKGLRSIVRQDPDVILVGEIRDRETAEIAVNAALTGHLLLSTFHANDAATAIPRLIDMGVEPFLLSSTLEVLIAQRLLRKIHEPCRKSITIKKEELRKQFSNIDDLLPGKTFTFYKGEGCAGCNHTGYEGRTATFEFIIVTPAIKSLIMNNPSTQQIWEVARKEGAKTLFENGLSKVKAGITTIEELLRVVPPSDNVQKTKTKKKKTT